MKVSAMQRIILIATIFSMLYFLILPAAGTESLITTNTTGSSQNMPAISGDWIVWADSRDGNSNIYAYNLLNGDEYRLTPSGADAYNPVISGNLVVWQDYRNGNYDIYLYDLGSGPEQQITTDPADQIFPAVDGNLITWQDNRDSTWDIYSYDITTHAESLLTPDTLDTDQINPAISGNLVVWQDYRFYNDMWGSNFYDIFMNDTISGALYNLSPGTDDTDQQYPAISGSRVIWQDDRNEIYGDIYLNDTSTGDLSRVNDDIPGSWKILPAISGNKVVWLDNRDRGGGLFDVYLKDLTSGPDMRITPEASQVSTGRGARISGNRVVWTDIRNGDDDIFLNSTDSVLECPVADFMISPSQSGAAPLTVQFTDTSTSGAGFHPVSHWKWESGDGNTSAEQNPIFTYSAPGTYDVRLTISNAYCRNETPVSNRYLISVGAAPVASFTTDTTSGMVPLTVTFSDTSVAATAWNWSFGDGTFSNLQSPNHLYSTAGTYTVTLNASNSYGYSPAHTTIHALSGANENADTNIDGISIAPTLLVLVIPPPPFKQHLIYNTTTLPGYINTGSSLICNDPALLNHGWQNITFLSNDGIGFLTDGTLIKWNISGVLLTTKEIHPAGFSVSAGPLSSVNYRITLPYYPTAATLNTQIWEGYTPEDLKDFGTIAHKAGFAELWMIAYTTKITKTNFPDGGTATLNMSVNSTWVENNKGKSHIYVERISDDRSVGEVLPSQFMYNDTIKNLDYFEIDSPHGFSTFGLTSLDGVGNLIQLFTLSVGEHIPNLAPSSDSTDPDSDGPASGTGAGAGKATVPVITTVATTAPTPVPTADPGTSAKIYSNGNGIVTQATRLRSSDGLVTVLIGEGVVARNATGASLAEITIRALPPGSLPAVPSGSVFTFAGMAYEILPDGATFSPPFSLSFVIPQARWGQEYSVKTWDSRSGTWQDLPSEFDGSTGTITAQVPHLCTFALFAQPIAAPATPATTPLPAVATTLPAAAPPPATAISTFAGMLSWATNLVVNNVVILAVAIVIVIAGYLVWQRKFPGAGQ